VDSGPSPAAICLRGPLDPLLRIRRISLAERIDDEQT
jgi:hypothetical protein